MVKKHMKAADGMYHINGHKCEKLEGSRAQVWHGTAHKTSGNLTKNNLMMNKNGRIVSKRKHTTAKNEKRLVKAGYLTKKGQFGFIKNSTTNNKARKTRKTRKTRKSRK
jgi:hypothetical protein